MNPTNGKKPSVYTAQILEFAGSGYGWLYLMAASLLLILPIAIVGIYNGVDLSQHAHFGSTYLNSISLGNLFPGWSAEENHGYGSLGVRFYPPMVPLLGAFLRLASGDWHTALWLLFWIYTFVGSLGIYLWAKEYVSGKYALLGGAIFMLMPYHVFEIYNASQFSEFAGCSVITFCFLFATRVCRNGTASDVLGLSVAYGILVFTHLPSTVIGSLALALYCLVMLRKEKLVSTLAKLATAVFFGLAATSVYWIKVVTEQSWIRKTTNWTDGSFDFHFNFLLSGPWFDNRNLWFLNSMFIMTVVLVSIALAHLYRNNSLGRVKNLAPVAVLFYFSAFMSTALSKMVWEITPFLPETQFPWRWMTISSIAAAVIGAAALQSVANLHPGFQNIKPSIQAFGAVFFISLMLFTVLTVTEFERNYIPSNKVEAWVTEQSSSMGGEFFWTPETRVEAFAISDRLIAGDRTASIELWNATERRFTVEHGSPTRLRVATLFYPHWKARINGTNAAVEKDEDGVIAIPLTSERSQVELYFEEPAMIQNAARISLFTWIAFAILALVFFGRKYIQNNSKGFP